ncbi:MAG: FixH family protein [Deltaproteobacteria bacterium]|jgi:hypothetical protein|nr:FixH family protein [Deltaproteobacteria bacterium]MBW2536322.1 FixH family protein [Deltaproteobacteria bacterium]
MKILKLFRAYRWPLFLMSFLVMSVTAQGVLVYVATRPDVPQPLDDYYERSQQWDRDSALRSASKQLGWKVTFQVPRGEQYLPGMPRPVDVEVRGQDGQAVTGLSGELVALRPSDQRLNARGTLTELPHAPGHYRTLVPLAAPGIWELNVDARRGGVRFVHSQRVSIAVPNAKGGASG